MIYYAYIYINTYIYICVYLYYIYYEHAYGVKSLIFVPHNFKRLCLCVSVSVCVCDCENQVRDSNELRLSVSDLTDEFSKAETCHEDAANRVLGVCVCVCVLFDYGLAKLRAPRCMILRIGLCVSSVCVCIAALLEISNRVCLCVCICACVCVCVCVYSGVQRGSALIVVCSSERQFDNNSYGVKTRLPAGTRLKQHFNSQSGRYGGWDASWCGGQAGCVVEVREGGVLFVNLPKWSCLVFVKR